MLPVWGISQTFLVLEKMGTKKRYEYYPGESIKVKMKGEEYYMTEYITSMSDSTLNFTERSVFLSNIDAINISSKPRRLKIARHAPQILKAGIGLFFIDQFNNVIVRGNSASIDRSITIASATIASTGALLLFTKPKTKKIKRWWRVRIVEIY